MGIHNSNLNLKLLKLLILVSVLGSAIYYYALELETHPDDDSSSLAEIELEESKESEIIPFFPKIFGIAFVDNFSQNTEANSNYTSSSNFNIQHKCILPKYILFHQLRLDC